MKYVAKVFKVLGLLFVAYVGYLIFAWNSSANEVETICSSIAINSPYQDVQDKVSNSKYAKITPPFENKGETFSLIHSPSSFGRYTCDLQLNQGKVINAKFVLLD